MDDINLYKLMSVVLMFVNFCCGVTCTTDILWLGRNRLGLKDFFFFVPNHDVNERSSLRLMTCLNVSTK